MPRRFKISVDGHEYNVSVEEVSEGTQSLYPDPQMAVPEPAPAAAKPAAAAPTPPPKAGPGEVVSPIAGVVVSVDVPVNAEVAEGEPLITLEAMKMKTIVSAGQSGKVASIAVAAGDPVEPGQLLLTIA